MKTYLDSFLATMKHHTLFLADNVGTTLFSLLIGLGVWLMEFVEIYIFSDFRYLLSLLLMLAYDAYAGIQRQKYLHKQNPGTFPAPSAKVFKDKTFSKLMYYLVVLASLHGLAHFAIQGAEVTLFHAFEYAALVTIMATEFWSVQENYAAMDRKTIFTLAWEKLKDFIPSKKTDGNPS